MIRKQNLKGGKQVKVTFVLADDLAYGTTAVVGDFNGWDPSAHVFKRRSNKTYSTSVTLEPDGRYAFRYLSDEAGWVNEDAADGYEPSGFGSDNCILLT